MARLFITTINVPIVVRMQNDCNKKRGRIDGFLLQKFPKSTMMIMQIQIKYIGMKSPKENNWDVAKPSQEPGEGVNYIERMEQYT